MLDTKFRLPSNCMKPFVRFYTERAARIAGPAIIHPAPARTCPMLGFYLRDTIEVEDNRRHLAELERLFVEPLKHAKGNRAEALARNNSQLVF